MPRVRITPVRVATNTAPFPCRPAVADGWQAMGTVFPCEAKAKRAAKLALDVARRRTSP